MKGYTKQCVETHSAGGIGGPYYPAVNVKVYGCDVDLDKIMARYGCTEKEAQEALNIAWECACEDFWNMDALDNAENLFGAHAKVFSAGRSSGWLIVEGIGFPDDWDGVQLHRWATFEKYIKQDVDSRSDDDSLLESIEANRWAGPLAAERAAQVAIRYGQAVA